MVDQKARPVPVPGEKLNLRHITIEPGLVLHRIHMSRFHATAFNDTPLGRARFSPIRNLAGEIIPTIYGAQTLHCAAMETIFRDLAYIPDPRHIDMTKFEGIVHSLVRVDKPLNLVDLTTKSLTAMGLTRRDIIDTDASHYDYTQRWAEAIHACCPEAQGLSWISRQDDTARAVVLFGDRVEDDSLSLTGPSRKVLHEEPTWSSLLDLLDILNVEATF